ncbi:MAG: MBL fold metallo-hydrolase [Nitrospiraceae bacterium]|nr:MAG: MBL fold metallo-hydrolase [Nitrospiraceae bacterium]
MFRVYRSESDDEPFLGKIRGSLVDRPGSLAAFAGIFSNFGINITFFHYDRSESPNRVLLEVTGRDLETFRQAYDELINRNLMDTKTPEHEELQIIDTRNLLKMEVQLENRPGTLALFASVLASHKANVIYMSYNEDVSETSANISLFTRDPEEVDVLLKDLNERGYYFSVVYKGAGQRVIEDVIGLNLTERFFFNLKKLLKTGDIDRLRRVIDSSKKISKTLVRFSNEAGKHFETGNVTTSILAFASASHLKTGNMFRYKRLPPVRAGSVTLHVFRLPTGGNICLLQGRYDTVMIDGGYGLYYEDVKKMFRENKIDPSCISRIYLTHADSDHAGLSGYFAEEFGSEVFLHEEARGILENENRAWGSKTPLIELNHFFTILVNEFTGFRVPEHWKTYKRQSVDGSGELQKVDSFALDDQVYHIVKSLGGHVPGQVFIYGNEAGLFFTADYLLSIESLSPEEREILSYPKFMMTSTNVDSPLFRKEMDLLRVLIGNKDAELRKTGRKALIVPGHGDYYPFCT